MITTFRLRSDRPSASYHCFRSQSTKLHLRNVSERKRVFCSKPQSEQDGNVDDEILLAEDDWTVPGGANDSLSSNTPLGKAVQSAIDELEHLGKLVSFVENHKNQRIRQEKEVLNEAHALLEKLARQKTKPKDKEKS